MLIHGAQRGDGRGSFAPFAEAFGPKLDVPRAKAFQPVGIGHHDGVRDAQILGEPDGDGGADRSRMLLRHGCGREFLDDFPPARAESGHVEPAGESGQGGQPP